MKSIKKIVWILIAASLSSSMYSCLDDEGINPAPPSSATGPNDIAAIANTDSRTDSMAVALNEANLMPIFQSANTYTLFAPNNQAFIDLLATDSTWNRIADIDAITLTNLLYYHTLGSEVKSTDLTDSSYATTLNTEGTPKRENTVIEVDLTFGAKLNNSVKVEAFNIQATNGVVHIIDQVMRPQNVLELANHDERFSSLVNAMRIFGDTITKEINGNGPYTVFAPTNEAFQRLLDSDTTWNSLSDIPRATLNAVLSYHIVNGVNIQNNEFTQNQTLTTLDNGTLTVNITSSAQLLTTDTMQGAVNITLTDIQGTNGVIHTVEEVLIP